MEVLTMYYYNNGDEKKGPFTLEELRNERIRPETLVKTEWMSEWKPAAQIPEVRALFVNKAFEAKPENEAKSPMPKTWLIESILVTLFCCLPFGIVALIYSSRVESRFFAGRIAEAQEASRSARTWVLVSLFTAIGSFFIYLLFMIVMGVSWMPFMMNN